MMTSKVFIASKQWWAMVDVIKQTCKAQLIVGGVSIYGSERGSKKHNYTIDFANKEIREAEYKVFKDGRLKMFRQVDYILSDISEATNDRDQKKPDI